MAVGAAILLYNSASTGPKAAIATPAAPAEISAPTVGEPQQQTMVADRWYEDATTSAASAGPVVSAPSIRDAWYLDHSAAAPAVVLYDENL
jgi:hypothetical protein